MRQDYKNINDDPDLLVRLLEKKINDLISENVVLREENKKLQLVFNSGLLSLWELNLTDGKIIFHNGIINKLGYLDSEIPTDFEAMHSIINEDDYLKLSELIEKIISGEIELGAIDYRIKSKSGKYFWLSDKISIIEKDADGNPTKVIAISFNNDEKKKFELALNQMLNNSLFGFVVFSKDKVVFVNKNVSNLIGYSKSEILSFTKNEIEKIIYNDDIPIFTKQYKEFESYNSSSHKFLFRVYDKSGKIIWLNGNFSKLIFGGSEALQLSFIDITELVRTEEEKINISEDFIKTIEELNIHIIRFKKEDDQFINTFSAGKLAGKIDISKGTESTNEKNILAVFGKEFYEIFHDNFVTAFSGKEVTFNFCKNNFWYTVILAPYRFDENGEVVEILGKINDSTDRVIAEQEIRKTSERLEIAHSAGNIAWWELNYKTRTVECDPNYSKILGYSLEDFPLTLDERLEFIHPEYLPLVEENVKEHTDGKTDFYEITYKAKTKDGNYKWVYDRGRIISRDEFGEPSKMLGVFMDVSQLKEAEAKYKLESEKGLAILKAIPDSMFIFDKEFRYIDYYVKNPDALYVPPEEFLGKRIDEVLPQVGNENVLDKHFKVLLENPSKVNTFEYSIVKNKETKYFESRVVFTGSFYLVMDREITNEKKHRLKVSEIAKRFRLATKTAQMGIWDWDLTKDRLIWDTGMYKIFEAQKHNSALNYEYWKVRINPDDRQFVDKEIDLAISGEKEFMPEYRIITSSGKLKYLKAFAQVFRDDNGKPIRMIGVNLDITERKLMEIELEQAKEKAEQSDKLKSEFLAQMSHEIRTPVNSLLSFSSLIFEDINQFMTDDIDQSFKIMGNAGKRIIRTVDLILNMSEIQTKTYEPIYEEIDVYEEIYTEQYLEFNLTAKEKSLTFSLNNNSQNSKVFGDKYTIGQIFANLIGNAIKYTNEGSIEVNFFNRDNFLIVEVKDTGIGILDEYKDNIFKPFTQEESGYTRRYEGNGLGLALVKEYCRINSVDISFASTKGKGTTFTLQFQNVSKENVEK